MAVHVFSMLMLTSLSEDEILLPRYMNSSSVLRGLSFNSEMAPFCLKYINLISDYCLLLNFLQLLIIYAMDFPLIQRENHSLLNLLIII